MAKTQQTELESFDEVRSLISKLQQGGYTMKGKWTLGQNCQHIATMMGLEQFVGKTPLGWIVELLRLHFLVATVGGAATRMGIRLPAAPFARPKQEKVSDEDGVANLSEAIARQEKRSFAKSSNRFHLWHCSHHLGFLEPEQAS